MTLENLATNLQGVSQTMKLLTQDILNHRRQGRSNRPKPKRAKTGGRYIKIPQTIKAIKEVHKDPIKEKGIERDRVSRDHGVASP
ncbi:Uncharacterized protein TCM_035591 [Theobroma cacao]|uniref:Uncharacterized protein n=1 Tax=Theobroma cacao TaxID=3641 RepID=A0A061FHD3_THECC|nr:Uncharacterized protein TCM_035591 [Theobroma cacao]